MTMRYWWYRFRSWLGDWPSWSIVYRTGERSHALRWQDARDRAEIFDGVRVEYARDENGYLRRFDA